MEKSAKQFLIENYRDLFFKYKDSPEATQNSKEGQLYRFNKIVEVGNISHSSILDLGCGIGDLYPFMKEKFENIQYTGMDIVSESVAFAAKKYPQCHFECRDVLEDGIPNKFDYVLICGVFNNFIPHATDFLKELITKAWENCNTALAFNFISTYVNFKEKSMAYHNPSEIFEYCLAKLSWKVEIHHHYNRCDVVVFVYR